MPSTGTLVLDLMCGDWGAARCTAKRWFEYMGTPDGVYVPFSIRYITNPNTTFTLHNPKIIPCNQAIDVSLPVHFFFFFQKTRKNCLTDLFNKF